MQAYAYDAYGNHLAGTGLTSADAAHTNLLYSGEWMGAHGQQYLRARFYDPSTGTFNRLDPFSGNMQDPQSLHKYLYTHGNPVMGVDPSGLFSLMNVVGGAILVSAVSHLYLTAGAGVGNTIFSPRTTSGLGGTDVTGQLYAIRDQYKQKWAAKTGSQKQGISNALLGPLFSGTMGLTALHAWDITEFAFSKGSRNPFTSGNAATYAEDSVTVAGSVYFQDEVNYFLWGLVNRLAYDDGINGEAHSWTSAQSLVRMYRAVLYPWEYGSGHIQACSLGQGWLGCCYPPYNFLTWQRRVAKYRR